MPSSDAIPKDVAFEICAEIQKENDGKLFSFAAWQCWGCLTFSRGEEAKRCVCGRPDYRGCNLVNERYDKRRQ